VEGMSRARGNRSALGHDLGSGRNPGRDGATCLTSLGRMELDSIAWSGRHERGKAAARVRAPPCGGRSADAGARTRSLHESR